MFKNDKNVNNINLLSEVVAIYSKLHCIIKSINTIIVYYPSVSILCCRSAIDIKWIVSLSMLYYTEDQCIFKKKRKND